MDSTVRDVMAAEVFSITEDTGYRDIVEALVSHRVSALPVTDPDGRVIGVVSEEDLLHKEEFKDDDQYWPPMRARLRSRLSGGGLRTIRAAAKAAAERAAELMTSPAVTVPPDASVVAAARLMERRGVKRLPVVDADQRLVGMVSRRDLLLVFLRQDADITEAVRSELADAARGLRTDRPDASVLNGVVTLSGSVERRSEAQSLVRRASLVEGVVSVVSELAWRIDDVIPEHVRWSSGH